MKNTPNNIQLAALPKLNETEHKKLDEKIIYLHFFLDSNFHWFITEYDGDDLFYGYAVLNGDISNGEWGTIRFSELKEIRVSGFLEVECDQNWEKVPATQILPYAQ